MPDKEELKRLQSLPLEDKVALTKIRIVEWYEHYNGAVYVSFSGGKDSTVLLDIARSIYPDMLGVYCDTGLEFPEVKEHVRKIPNIKIIRPKMTFKQVIDKYGWVYPSKSVAHVLHGAQNGKDWGLKFMNGYKKDGTESWYCKTRFYPHRYLINAPFKISEYCCDAMKKRPSKKYSKETGTYPIMGTMASESSIRRQSWLKEGCNAYNSKRVVPSSKPMSFWTEEDVLQYIVKYNIPIPTVYGDIVTKNGKLCTTGEHRTGCMFCLVGVKHDKGNENRFQRMKRLHPEIYSYCMEELNMREVLDFIGVPY